MDNVDIIIIGAGVVGLAIAKELADPDKTILILEQYDSFGRETSSRNSEVIHAGLYYPKGSLKAKLCVEGRHLLYDICSKNRIPFKKIGKLIVATEKEEIPALEKLYQQGVENGVENLKIIDTNEITRIEPNAKGLAALHSPETGIFDSHCFMQYLLENAKRRGVLCVFSSEVSEIEKISDGYKISVKNNHDVQQVQTRVLINAAGLDSDTIAKMTGFDVVRLKYNLHYCKGEYFRANGKKIGAIGRLIYPVPKPKSGGLGIHATLDLGGSLRLGPDDAYLDNRNKDYSVDNNKLLDFYESAKKFMPFLSKEVLMPDMAGIRPKLQDQGEPFRDFVIQEETANGFPGFINLIGIESPGLTASPAIARVINEMIP